MSTQLNGLEELSRKKRLKWAFRLRRRTIIGLLAIYVLAVLLKLVPPSFGVVGFLLFFFGVNEVRELLFQTERGDERGPWTTVLVEIAAVVAILYFTGGVESPVVGLAVFQVLAISIHVGYERAWISAYVSTAAFSVVNLLEYFAIIPHGPVLHLPPGEPAAARSLPYMILASTAYGVLLSLTAYASGYVASKLKVREDLLTRANRIQTSLYRLSSKLLGELSSERAAQIMTEWLVEDLRFSKAVVEVMPPGRGTVRISYPRTGVDLEEIERLVTSFPTKAASVHVAGYQYVPLANRDNALGWIMVGCPTELTADEWETLETSVNHFTTFLQKANYHQHILDLSIVDEMTGVHNHRHFVTCARAEIKRAWRYKQPLSLLIVDVDFFKNVNDRHGHLVGDFILKELAQRLRNSVRVTDVVARYGGEEFVVLAPQTDRPNAFGFAERLRRAVGDKPFTVNGLALNVTASFGVAECLQDTTQTEDDLIKAADARLYRAKEAGRNRVVAEG